MASLGCDLPSPRSPVCTSHCGEHVRSIASVPAILNKGKDWFKSMGSEKSPGFTLYSLSGHVTSPGQYEAPLGITLRQLLDMSGGMRAGHRLKFWTPGGSSTPMFTEEHQLDALAGGVGLGRRRVPPPPRRCGLELLPDHRAASGWPGCTAGALSAAIRPPPPPARAWCGSRAGRATGARWRRARCRGAAPAAAPATDPRARDEVAALWRLAELPSRPGRDTGRIIEAAATGELGALLVAGVGVEDLPDPNRALQALNEVGVLVSLELRPTAVTARADVVFPVVAAVAEKSGTFLNWEGRVRMFEAALKPEQMTRTLAPTDLRVLHMLADAMDVHFALPDLASARRELDRLGGGRADARTTRARPPGRCPGPATARPSSPATACCSTSAGSRRATPPSPGPGTRPSQGCRRPPPPRPASRTATRSPSPARPAPSNCRSPSPTCRTGWSGCR
ncbi:hypothetical protein SCALM49S_02834 [Streptomyces californicus]